MVAIIKVSKSDLESLRETCSVHKQDAFIGLSANPFGLSTEEYERGVYVVNGTFENLRKILDYDPTFPLKIYVVLAEEN
ncbi:hypothetical protein KKH23_10410 [Patescibacteria group bacterium]|nr:hypothetical protein [Patescibacteria group bacterium]